MKLNVQIILIALFFFGCTRGDVINVAAIAITGDTLSAGNIATRKMIGYAANPKALERDIKSFEKNFNAIADNFRKTVDLIWGKNEGREPEPRTYVKYTQNYLSRAFVDFDRGWITVETVDPKTPLLSLKNAITTTLLTPDDPRAVDLYSAQSVKLGQTPFLYGEVKDHFGKNVRWHWRAEQFATHLIETGLKSRQSNDEDRDKTIQYVSIPMVEDHLHLRAKRYQPLVERFAGRYSVSKNLIYAIMKTESNFNPYAVSTAPAFGLMQIVPSSAGLDVSTFLKREGLPSDKFLFIPENNIQYGTAYLHLLETRYFSEINNPVSREYCMIAGYNTGAGNVFRTFDRNRERAVTRINSLSPLEVIHILQTRLPYNETRRYLSKVIEAKKTFIF